MDVTPYSPVETLQDFGELLDYSVKFLMIVLLMGTAVRTSNPALEYSDF
jgi:hypothetical protein